MRRTAILMLILSLFLGVLAVYLARDWVEEQVASSTKVETKQINLTTVVIAKRPLRFGDELNSSSMAEVEWPAESVPPGSFRAIKEVVGTGERRVVLKGIQLNEPVLKSKVSGFGGRATLSTIIDSEFRAVTIRVNDVNGVAGFVLPGDRVDILLTRSPKASNESITDVLMQNIKVLGIDQDAAEDKDKPKVVRAVTLEVTTEQSQKLTLAQTVGQLALTLRGATNKDSIVHRRIREKDLVDDRIVEDRKVSADSAPKAKTPVKKVVRVRPRNTRNSVRVYRGLEPKTVEVPGEAAPKRTSRPASVPTRLVPKQQKSAGDGPGKDTDRARQDNPASTGPTRLTPKPSNDGTPRSIAPGPEKPIGPKARDSMVEIPAPRFLVLRQ